MDYFIMFGVGFVLGIAFTISYYSHQLQRARDEFYDGLEKQIAKNHAQYLLVRIEITDGIIYAFEAKTNKFVAQANTFDSFMENLRSARPNQNIHVTKDDMRLLEEFKSEPI